MLNRLSLRIFICFALCLQFWFGSGLSAFAADCNARGNFTGSSGFVTSSPRSTSSFHSNSSVVLNFINILSFLCNAPSTYYSMAYPSEFYPDALERKSPGGSTIAEVRARRHTQAGLYKKLGRNKTFKVSELEVAKSRDELSDEKNVIALIQSSDVEDQAHGQFIIEAYIKNQIKLKSKNRELLGCQFGELLKGTIENFVKHHGRSSEEEIISDFDQLVVRVLKFVQGKRLSKKTKIDHREGYVVYDLWSDELLDPGLE